ncbi:cell wall metabolism sensor histidine kinase WalK [Geomicrobium sp. JCM 19038]|uniref:sensor histidine kinase n=1 Tax=Geomicrobium sp. JCM 19038 TaxID=1460635 RepID=UPI00045F3C8D|nr:HAMP domain-containing sensor histidine kinase [Geomicrobium sp. JCM 19038]GAK08820.1 sensor histidine kinase [Geomicrobium sp. JCM 19038]
MRSFYVRMLLITFTVMILSSLLAFTLANGYYQFVLQEQNEEKIEQTARDVAQFLTDLPSTYHEDYLIHAGELGYQVTLLQESGYSSHYGTPYRDASIPGEVIAEVLEGTVYRGITAQEFEWFVTGFFNNVATNTIGVPVQIEGERYALFIRPDVEQNLGEFRSFLAILLVLTLLFSFLFIAIAAKRIVKPIVSLTEATKQISEGEFQVDLNVRRQDEIGQLAKHFKSMSRELGQLDAMRQEFVSNVSHEIQSPLATISATSHALQANDISDKERITYSELIETESLRLSSLSKQLLTLASLDQETDVVNKETIDLEEQIKGVVRSLIYQAQQKDIYIQLDTFPYTITGDPLLLHQVWENLIFNAIKFTPTGGTIHITFKDDQVSIQDNGIGMTEQQINRVYERFYKVDEARTNEQNSTGLGLSIVKKIVDLHGADINVTSTVGIGTTFTVTF